MKRYLTFIGAIYYPSGGMDDFKGDFDTIEEAQNFIEEKVEQQWEYTWAHIWDTETRSEVWSK